MDAARVAEGAWALACSEQYEWPVVYELGACDCPRADDHAAHVVRSHHPLDADAVIATVQDLCCLPETEALTVWTRTTWPAGAHLLFIAATDECLALVGEMGDRPRVLEAVRGVLYDAAVTALRPVPADDPLVVELAEISDN